MVFQRRHVTTKPLPEALQVCTHFQPCTESFTTFVYMYSLEHIFPASIHFLQCVTLYRVLGCLGKGPRLCAYVKLLHYGLYFTLGSIHWIITGFGTSAYLDFLKIEKQPYCNNWKSPLSGWDAMLFAWMIFLSLHLQSRYHRYSKKLICSFLGLITRLGQVHNFKTKF